MTFYHGQGYWHRLGGNGGGGPSSGEISFKSVSVITIGGGGRGHNGRRGAAGCGGWGENKSGCFKLTVEFSTLFVRSFPRLTEPSGELANFV